MGKSSPHIGGIQGISQQFAEKRRINGRHCNPKKFAIRTDNFPGDSESIVTQNTLKWRGNCSLIGVIQRFRLLKIVAVGEILTTEFCPVDGDHRSAFIQQGEDVGSIADFDEALQLEISFSPLIFGRPFRISFNGYLQQRISRIKAPFHDVRRNSGQIQKVIFFFTNLVFIAIQQKIRDESSQGQEHDRKCDPLKSEYT